MNTLTEKFARIEEEISQERGPFNLFAVFEREELMNRPWDLVVAAPWMAGQYSESLDYMVAAVKRHLEREDLMQLARIILLDASDRPVRAITEAIDVEHGRVLVSDADSTFGLPVRRGYVITSKRAA